MFPIGILPGATAIALLLFVPTPLAFAFAGLLVIASFVITVRSRR